MSVAAAPTGSTDSHAIKRTCSIHTKTPTLNNSFAGTIKPLEQIKEMCVEGDANQYTHHANSTDCGDVTKTQSEKNYIRSL